MSAEASSRSPSARPSHLEWVSRSARAFRRTAQTVWASVHLAREALGTQGEDATAKAHLLRKMSLRFCDIYDLRISVRGTLPPGPKIVVMNHLGYVDPMLFGALEAYLSIAKSEVARWPGVGDLARALGVLFVVRGDAYSGFRVLREVRRALDAGATVLNFPEGTTSDGRDVLPFHRGVFGVARHAGVPVVPVHLRFSNPDLAWIDDQTFMPHFLKFLGSESEAVELQILGAIEPGAAESAEGLAEHARQALRRVDPARLS